MFGQFPYRGSNWFQLAQMVIPLSAAGIGLYCTARGWLIASADSREQRKAFRRDQRARIKRAKEGEAGLIPLFGVNRDEDAVRKNNGKGTAETQGRILDMLREARQKSSQSVLE